MEFEFLFRCASAPTFLTSYGINSIFRGDRPFLFSCFLGAIGSSCANKYCCASLARPLRSCGALTFKYVASHKKERFLIFFGLVIALVFFCKIIGTSVD